MLFRSKIAVESVDLCLGRLIAAACLNLLGYRTPEGYDPSLVEIGS